MMTPLGRDDGRMGHEVMDEQGAFGPSAAHAGPQARHVVDLGADDGPGEPEVPRARSPRWRGPLLPVGAALVVGALLGGFVAAQQSAAAQQAQRRAQLAVVAQVQAATVDRDGTRVSADLTVRVTNAGPEPVTVATQPLGARPSVVQRVVVTGTGRLAGGSSQVLRVQVLLDCATAAASAPALSVRTADHRTHAVALLPSERSDESTLAAVCADAGDQAAVRGRVVGTTDHPFVTVTNDGDIPVGVSFASVVSKGDPKVEGLVTLLTTPALPLVVAAHSERRVAISVRVARCVRDVATLAELADVSYPTLVVTDQNGRVLRGGERGPSAVSVDLSLLVSQAAARTCN